MQDNHLETDKEKTPKHLTSAVMSLFAHLTRIIEDDYMHSHRTLRSKADKKLRRMIEQKKEHLGIKSDSTLCYEQ